MIHYRLPKIFQWIWMDLLFMLWDFFHFCRKLAFAYFSQKEITSFSFIVSENQPAHLIPSTVSMTVPVNLHETWHRSSVTQSKYSESVSLLDLSMEALSDHVLIFLGGLIGIMRSAFLFTCSITMCQHGGSLLTCTI